MENAFLNKNHAENGGAIHSTESKLYVNGDATIAHNRATANGGGVYLSFSELNCQQKSTFQLLNNTVETKEEDSTLLAYLSGQLLDGTNTSAQKYTSQIIRRRREEDCHSKPMENFIS